MHETEWVIPHPASRIGREPVAVKRSLAKSNVLGHTCRAMLVGTCLELNGSRSPVVRSWCDEMTAGRNGRGVHGSRLGFVPSSAQTNVPASPTVAPVQRGPSSLWQYAVLRTGTSLARAHDREAVRPASIWRPHVRCNAAAQRLSGPWPSDTKQLNLVSSSRRTTAICDTYPTGCTRYVACPAHRSVGAKVLVQELLSAQSLGSPLHDRAVVWSVTNTPATGSALSPSSDLANMSVTNLIGGCFADIAGLW
ncbi:hypothetical protein Purlil1_3064 [Purpureocillium lilacinum]|uniref:Uncharacterized protein n=1 Tax=Purpureocillium lilacinum TaxID=33203 RepID=A0ABR0C7T2_PURLI|nr:hypothetical protein Purlil1_3064 [Purpureocillium lilacinum]